MRLSAIILTKNEETNIKNCLSSLGFCDEIIIVCDGEIQKLKVKSEKLKVFHRHLNNDFAEQRNFGVEKAKGEWVLFVDADEEIPKALALEVSSLPAQAGISGFYIKRKDATWGRAADVKLLRFAKKNSGIWKRRVHEVWDVKGRTQLLKNPLLHHSDPSLARFIKRINFYSTLHAEANLQEGKRSTLIKIIFFPPAKFCYYLFIKLGILDGTKGFVFSLIMSFHSFLSWAKLWIKQKS